jgi:uncharacterized circularly permuted ATP-grasp superfamily protein
MEAVLPQLAGSVIKSTYGGAGAGAVLGRNPARARARRMGRPHRARSDEYTVQAYLPLSQMPTWKQRPRGDRIVPRSLLLRVFAVSDGAQAGACCPAA